MLKKAAQQEDLEERDDAVKQLNDLAKESFTQKELAEMEEMHQPFYGDISNEDFKERLYTKYKVDTHPALKRYIDGLINMVEQTDDDSAKSTLNHLAHAEYDDAELDAKEESYRQQQAELDEQIARRQAQSQHGIEKSDGKAPRSEVPAALIDDENTIDITPNTKISETPQGRSAETESEQTFTIKGGKVTGFMKGLGIETAAEDDVIDTDALDATIEKEDTQPSANREPAQARPAQPQAQPEVKTASTEEQSKDTPIFHPPTFTDESGRKYHYEVVPQEGEIPFRTIKVYEDETKETPEKSSEAERKTPPEKSSETEKGSKPAESPAKNLEQEQIQQPKDGVPEKVANRTAEMQDDKTVANAVNAFYDGRLINTDAVDKAAADKNSPLSNLLENHDVVTDKNGDLVGVREKKKPANAEESAQQEPDREQGDTRPQEIKEKIAKLYKKFKTDTHPLIKEYIDKLLGAYESKPVVSPKTKHEKEYNRLRDKFVKELERLENLPDPTDETLDKTDTELKSFQSLQGKTNSSETNLETEKQVQTPKKGSLSAREQKRQALHAKLKTDTHPNLKTWLENLLKAAGSKDASPARTEALNQLKEIEAVKNYSDAQLDTWEHMLSNKEKPRSSKTQSLPEGEAKFTATVYHFPNGEEGEDISNWTMEDLKEVVKEFYEINNISSEDNINNDNEKKEIIQKEEEIKDNIKPDIKIETPSNNNIIESNINKNNNNTNEDNKNENEIEKIDESNKVQNKIINDSTNINDKNKNENNNINELNNTSNKNDNKNEDKNINENNNSISNKKKDEEETIKFIIDEDSLMDFMLATKGINKKNKEVDNKNNFNSNNIEQNKVNTINNNNINNKIDNNLDFNGTNSNNIINTNINSNPQFNFDKNFNNNINNNQQKFNFEQNFKNNNLEENNNNIKFNFDKNFNNINNNQQKFNFEQNFKNINTELNFEQNFNNNTKFDFNKNFKNENNNFNSNNVTINDKSNNNENENESPSIENKNNHNNNINNNIIDNKSIIDNKIEKDTEDNYDKNNSSNNKEINVENNNNINSKNETNNNENSNDNYNII